MKKSIYDITPFTSLDYKDHLSCIVWFCSCNMKCQYCYNSNIVFSNKGKYDEKDLVNFLNKRINLLDSVVLSGGEATLHPLENLCRKIKDLGFLIKLDTNGLAFEKIKNLVDLKLIDYISLDFKALPYKFEKITKNSNFSFFEKSLDYLISKNFDFEVRTTIQDDLLSVFDLNRMIYFLKKKGYKNTYFLQEYIKTKTNIENLNHNSKFDKNRLLNRGLTIKWRD